MVVVTYGMIILFKNSKAYIIHRLKLYTLDESNILYVFFVIHTYIKKIRPILPFVL